MTFAATAIDSPSNPWVFLAWFGCICGIYIFGQGLLLLRRRQRVNSVARIREVKPGPIFVGGWAEGTDTVSATLSGKPCFYYRATVWRQEDSSDDDSWEIVAEETQGKPFVLNDLSGKDASRNGKTEGDRSGSILVDPRGAQFDLPRDTYEEYGKTLLATFTDIPDRLDKFLKRNKVDLSAALRVEEYLLSPGAETFVQGVAVANPDMAQSTSGSSQGKKKHARESAPKSTAPAPRPAPQVIQLSPEAANRPAAEMTMQSRVAAALALARVQSPETATLSPLHIPAISVAVAETSTEQPENQIQAHAHIHPFNEENQKRLEPAVSATTNPSQPPLLLRRQDGSRFTISYRNLPAPEPSSLRRAAAFLMAGPLMTLASAYSLLTILGLL